MAHMLNSHYKELCDKIKVEILNSLIKLTEKRKATDGKQLPILTKYDLILIRDGIEELRTKEREIETNAIAQVITHLIERGNKEISEQNDN